MNRREITQNIDKAPDTGHWIWQGRMSKGYAVAWYEGRLWQVARLVYERNTHKPLARTTALHRLCEHERCVNPEHHSPQNVAAPISPYKLESGEKWRLRDTSTPYHV